MTDKHLYRYSPGYDEPDEREFDPDEPVEPFEEPVNGTNGHTNGDGNGDSLMPTGEHGVVISGDPSAGAARGKGADKAPKDKKIPHEKRTTTPYMTKYERARILGTRALQIRFVNLDIGL